MLPLPIAPAVALASIIDPALALLPPKLTSDKARLMLLATALQEVGAGQGDATVLRTRVQDGDGPAHGLTQYERGGILAVLSNPTTSVLARALCAVRGVPATGYSVHTALLGDDVLGLGLCRLQYFADPAPLPELGDEVGALQAYLRVQRPGAWARDPDGVRRRWHNSYGVALRTLKTA